FVFCTGPPPDVHSFPTRRSSDLAFDTDRYVLTFEDAKLREVAAQAPYDALILLFNDRKYGGGGIYNLWATCAADSEQAPYVFVRSEEHTSELQSRSDLVCRLLLE